MFSIMFSIEYNYLYEGFILIVIETIYFTSAEERFLEHSTFKSLNYTNLFLKVSRILNI